MVVAPHIVFKDTKACVAAHRVVASDNPFREIFGTHETLDILARAL